jgi:S-adenosylmethionine hydrolase
MSKPLVLQSDFGLVDGAVSAMTGVALSVNEELRVYTLSHSVTQFNIFEASYRLFQAVSYWPEGSVFVYVVDPGVGSDRNSVVVLTKSGHYIVTPNNGTLSHIKKYIGIKDAVIIDVAKNRRKGASSESYTFDGRDLYAYVGARLASGMLKLSEIGEHCSDESVHALDLPGVEIKDHLIIGSIEIFDERYGSVWSSIPVEHFKAFNPEFGHSYRVKILDQDTVIYDQKVVYGHAFTAVNVGETLLYVSSLNRMALALNQGSIKDYLNLTQGMRFEIDVNS